MFVHLAITTNSARQAHFTCQFQKHLSQAHVCVMAKLTNFVRDKQKFKCLPNSACSFGKPHCNKRIRYIVNPERPLKPQPNVQTLLNKHFEFFYKHILLVNFKNIFSLSQIRNVCHSHVCVMAKLTNILLSGKKFKCLPKVIAFEEGATPNGG